MAFLNRVLKFIMRKENLNGSKHPVLNGHTPLPEDLQPQAGFLSTVAAWPDDIDEEEDDDDLDPDEEVEVTEEVEVDPDPDVDFDDDDIDLDDEDDDEIDDI
jgi:hypothetical protein